jgi:hypothetical protein
MDCGWIPATAAAPAPASTDASNEESLDRQILYFILDIL